MGTDNDKTGNNQSDELSELLKKHYKSEEELNPELFWKDISKKIDSLFHKEIFSSRIINELGESFTEEERYWLGFEEYINNKMNSLKHKSITDHLLLCKECRQNYNKILDKKKETIDLNKIRINNFSQAFIRSEA